MEMPEARPWPSVTKVTILQFVNFNSSTDRWSSDSPPHDIPLDALGKAPFDQRSSVCGKEPHKKGLLGTCSSLDCNNFGFLYAIFVQTNITAWKCECESRKNIAFEYIKEWFRRPQKGEGGRDRVKI